MPRPIDPVLLQAALVGLEAQRERVDEQIAQVRAALRQRGGNATAPRAKPAGKRRVLNAAARKRIAAAQRKRWAEWRKQRKAAKAKR
jgi:hypothetical protein